MVRVSEIRLTRSSNEYRKRLQMWSQENLSWDWQGLSLASGIMVETEKSEAKKASVEWKGRWESGLGPD